MNWGLKQRQPAQGQHGVRCNLPFFLLVFLLFLMRCHSWGDPFCAPKDKAAWHAEGEQPFVRRAVGAWDNHAAEK